VVISIQLVAGDLTDQQISVSTTIQIPTGDAHWQTWLVDCVTTQAQEGARRLRDQLVAQQALPGIGFVPLAAVVPSADAGR